MSRPEPEENAVAVEPLATDQLTSEPLSLSSLLGPFDSVLFHRNTSVLLLNTFYGAVMLVVSRLWDAPFHSS